MKFSLLTLFPEPITAYVKSSILGRAIKNRRISVEVINFRQFARDKHGRVDNKPYGGGPGMVLMAEPILRAVRLAQKKSKIAPEKTLIILTDAAGKQFNQKHAKKIAAKFKHVVFIAGHYEGVDARVSQILKANSYKLSAFSIGPYILTGGELPALVMAEAISRHITGVLGKSESLEESRGGIGSSIFTRPETFTWPEKKGKQYTVPKVLRSGNHAKIEEWRRRRRNKL